MVVWRKLSEQKSSDSSHLNNKNSEEGSRTSCLTCVVSGTATGRPQGPWSPPEALWGWRCSSTPTVTESSQASREGEFWSTLVNMAGYFSKKFL